MKKLWNRRGEMLVESLISMLIIVMTGMMVAMAAAALQANAQASQTATFVSADRGDAVGISNASLVDIADDGNTFSIGIVAVKKQGGLYYYEISS